MYISNGKLSDANKYVMPSVDDYLATRCLLLNGIFVGLTTGHEAIEKILKATLISEDIDIPKSCHEINKLAGLLIKKDLTRYSFLQNNVEFIGRLDKHYGWRYYDGDPQQRSQSKSTSELQPIDGLYVALYENYMNLAPEEFRFRDYLTNYLFGQEIKKHTTWSVWLLTDNNALHDKIVNWENQFKSVRRASA
jgi:hypothetical protein